MGGHKTIKYHELLSEHLLLVICRGRLLTHLTTGVTRLGAGVLAVKWETPFTLLSCGYDTVVRLWDTRIING